MELLLSWAGDATALRLHRANEGRYKTADDAEAALQGLVDAALADWSEKPAGPKGGRPTRVCILKPYPTATKPTQPLTTTTGTTAACSSPLAAVPDSCPSVSACSPTIPPRTHPQPSLLPPLSPLVSAAQNVPLLCLSSKDSLSFLLGNSRPGARTLTLPNHPTIPLSTARAFAPTVVVSVLTEIRLNPPLTFVNYPYRIASSDLPTLLPTSFTSPLNPTLRRTNRESRMQNP